MRTERLKTFDDIKAITENDWTPVWIALDDDNDHAEVF